MRQTPKASSARSHCKQGRGPRRNPLLGMTRGERKPAALYVHIFGFLFACHPPLSTCAPWSHPEALGEWLNDDAPSELELEVKRLAVLSHIMLRRPRDS